MTSTDVSLCNTQVVPFAKKLGALIQLFQNELCIR